MSKTQTSIRLTTEALAELWKKWGSNSDLRHQRFGQYVINTTGFRPPKSLEQDYNIDLFYSTNHKRCYGVIQAYLSDIKS